MASVIQAHSSPWVSYTTHMYYVSENHKAWRWKKEKCYAIISVHNFTYLLLHRHTRSLHLSKYEHPIWTSLPAHVLMQGTDDYYIVKTNTRKEISWRLIPAPFSVSTAYYCIYIYILYIKRKGGREGRMTGDERDCIILWVCVKDVTYATHPTTHFCFMWPQLPKVKSTQVFTLISLSVSFVWSLVLLSLLYFIMCLYFWFIFFFLNTRPIFCWLWFCQF